MEVRPESSSLRIQTLAMRRDDFLLPDDVFNQFQNVAAFQGTLQRRTEICMNKS